MNLYVFLGLDAFHAKTVTDSLVDLARRGRTVIISIHQPRYEIFLCFDDIVLLSKGKLVWSGPACEMMQHFESIGFPCPSHTNPAEFIIDISSVQVQTSCLVLSYLMMKTFLGNPKRYQR